MKKLVMCVAAALVGLVGTFMVQAGPITTKTPAASPSASSALPSALSKPAASATQLALCVAALDSMSSDCLQKGPTALAKKAKDVKAEISAVASAATPPVKPPPPAPPPKPVEPVCDPPAKLVSVGIPLADTKRCVCPAVDGYEAALVQIADQGQGDKKGPPHLTPHLTCVLKRVKPAAPTGVDPNALKQALESKADKTALDKLSAELDSVCPKLADKPTASFEERCAAARKGGKDVSAELEELCPPLLDNPTASLVARCQSRFASNEERFAFLGREARRGRALLSLETGPIGFVDPGVRGSTKLAGTEFGGHLTAKFGLWVVPRFAVYLIGSGQITHGYNVSDRIAGCVGIGTTHMWGLDPKQPLQGGWGLRLEVPIFCQYVSLHQPPYKGQTERWVGASGPGLTMGVSRFFSGRSGIYLALDVGGRLRKEGHMQDAPMPYETDSRWHAVAQAALGLGWSF